MLIKAVCFLILAFPLLAVAEKNNHQTVQHAANQEGSDTTGLNTDTAEQELVKVLGGLASKPAWQHFQQFESAGFSIDSPQGLKRFNADQPFVPASTTKLITALLALKHWGADYRFTTEFYLKRGERNVLLVKGFGDPFLVSEELSVIAETLANKLKQRGVGRLGAIYLDSGFYQQGLILPGTTPSDNPYDAIPSAIAANFNTINVKSMHGQIVSAEPQTPLTPTAKRFAVHAGLHTTKPLRMNLGQDWQINQRNFAELLAAFLTQRHIEVSAAEVVWQSLDKMTTNNLADDGVSLLYRHQNSRLLSDIIKPMMKYSTNFIANQLALNLAADIYGAPANAEKVALLYKQKLGELFDWRGFSIEEGAGLSRQNRLTPHQLMDVLHAFKPWMTLLPEIEKGVLAKSGSLIGVSTLAGFYQYQNEFRPFVIMINEQGPYRLRNRLARELAKFYR